MNLYAYVGNDPMNFTDPWGLQAEPVDDEIVIPGSRQAFAIPGGQVAAWAALASATAIYIESSRNDQAIDLLGRQLTHHANNCPSP